MGIERNTARLLLQAQRAGAGFRKVLTVGRQNFFVNNREIQSLVREFSLPADRARALKADDLIYAEPFFRQLLGAEVVESVDASGYEGATHVHDLNYPLPSALKNAFDAVVDAGSLEHIMNFPAAIRSLMECVKPGGRLFIQTPANNYFGHGFYQFSPELFFRVFSEENGFQTERMIVFEHFFPAHFFASPWYEVTDPKAARKRVQLVNKRPVLLMVQALKLREAPIFAAVPQQSDYVSVWREGGDAGGKNSPGLLERVKHLAYRIPLRFTGHLWAQYAASRKFPPNLRNKVFFRRTD